MSLNADVDADGRTALHNVKDVTEAQLLINSLANVNICDSLGYPPLRYARTADMTALLITYSRPEYYQTEYGVSALHMFDDPSLICYLLDQHIDPNLHPRHAIIIPSLLSKNQSITRTLLDIKYDPTIHNVAGNTALHLAKDTTVVQLLIDAYADINAINSYGLSPLFYSSHADITRLLLEYNAIQYGVPYMEQPCYIPSYKPHVGLTPLHRASNAQIVKLLVEYKANLAAQTATGQTVLHTIEEDDAMQQVLYEMSKYSFDGHTIVPFVPYPHLYNDEDVLTSNSATSDNSNNTITIKQSHNTIPLLQHLFQQKCPDYPIFRPCPQLVQLFIKYHADMYVLNSNCDTIFTIPSDYILLLDFSSILPLLPPLRYTNDHTHLSFSIILFNSYVFDYVYNKNLYMLVQYGIFCDDLYTLVSQVWPLNHHKRAHNGEYMAIRDKNRSNTLYCDSIGILPPSSSRSLYTTLRLVLKHMFHSTLGRLRVW